MNFTHARKFCSLFPLIPVNLGFFLKFKYKFLNTWLSHKQVMFQAEITIDLSLNPFGGLGNLVFFKLSYSLGVRPRRSQVQKEKKKKRSVR